MGKTVNPVWVSGHWRLRNDDGTMATATYKAAEDTSTSVEVNTKFRLRISWGESAGQTTSTSSGTITLQFAINGGGFTTIGAATAVKYVTSGTVTDGTTEGTQRLTLPTGVASFPGSGWFDSNNNVAAQTLVDGGAEAEFCLQLDSASISNGDSITFKLQHGAADFDSYDTTPTLSATGAQNLTASLFTNSQTFYAATVGRGSVALAPTLVTNSQTFHAATVTSSYPLTPALVDIGQIFYAATATPGAFAVTPSLFTNNETFYAATVGLGGAQDLQPAPVDIGQTFHAATVSATYGLAPSLVTNSQTLYSATIAAGAVDLTPSLITNSQSFPAATVSLGSGPQQLSPSLVTNSQTFHAATVQPGAIDLTPSLVTNSQIFHAPTLGASNTIAPALVANDNSFPAASVLPGAVDVQPGLSTNSSAFFGPTVSQPLGQELLPGVIASGNVFYAASAFIVRRKTVSREAYQHIASRPGDTMTGGGRPKQISAGKR